MVVLLIVPWDYVRFGGTSLTLFNLLAIVFFPSGMARSRPPRHSATKCAGRSCGWTSKPLLTVRRTSTEGYSGSLIGA